MMKPRSVIPDHAEMDSSRILPRVFLGTNACCQRHFDIRLLRRGITADISLEAERIDAPIGVTYFLWLPTVDQTAPSQKALDLGSRTIDWLLKNGEKIYLHCKNGHGRAPTLLAAYFIRYRHLSVEAAIRFIKIKRPEIHPNSGQRLVLQRFAR